MPGIFSPSVLPGRRALRMHCDIRIRCEVPLLEVEPKERRDIGAECEGLGRTFDVQHACFESNQPRPCQFARRRSRWLQSSASEILSLSGGRAKITANYDAGAKYQEDQGVRQVIEVTYGDLVVVYQLVSAL